MRLKADDKNASRPDLFSEAEAAVLWLLAIGSVLGSEDGAAGGGGGAADEAISLRRKIGLFVIWSPNLRVILRGVVKGEGM